MDDNRLVYKAATNPVLAVRLASGPGYPRPGYPERLVWKDIPGLIEYQEQIYNAIKTLIPADVGVLMARFGEQTTLQKYGDRIGRSRERVRQLEARALRKIRFHLRTILPELREATEIISIPGSALDPDWIGTKEAAQISGYTRSHLRYLCRTGRVISQRNPLRRNHLQISRLSLSYYILLERQDDGRKTGKWREDEQA